MSSCSLAKLLDFIENTHSMRRSLWEFSELVFKITKNFPYRCCHGGSSRALVAEICKNKKALSFLFFSVNVG